MNKLVLVITDGVGFKNYVLSDFLKEAINNFEEVIIFSALPKSCYDGFLAENCTFEELEDYKESGETWFFRKLKEVAHLQNHKKNIKVLNGKPLIQYTVEAAFESKKLTHFILSSDDEVIINVAKQLNVEVPFVRPKHLAEDTSPTLGVIQHALKFYKEQDIHFDAVCLLQVTNPFKTGTFIDEAIDKFVESGCDALVSVQQVPDEYNPHWTFKETTDGYLELVTGEESIISRRQDLPDVYHRDGLIYITKTNVLLEQNSLYGSKLAHIKSPSDYTINIDTPDDWKQAEAFLNSKNI